ncbi:MAG: GTPase ObgE, partial [Candidatus Sumerlaeia bacterium]|nr:GTPase ObgE [Candidatus Sumerlaeia bacterium]
MKAFVDFVRFSAKGGDGGHGCSSFMRTKETAFGGPDGGDGGAGGSVYLEGKAALMTLVDIKMKPYVAAPRGKNGSGKNCSGRAGEDIIIHVPLGTCVVDEDTGEELGEIVADGERFLVAKGGDGGKGNQHYATPTNKAPTLSYEGWPGEERKVYLELKIIADVGFVGLPNAGKSTLLKALTNANPEIAPYPFTTLSPNLGVFLTSDFERRITLADIPGLIEGAHTGAGLGTRFLRHIERTRVLLHLVAPESGLDDDGNPVLANADPQTVLYAYNLVREELRSYSEALLVKPFVIALNKCDLLTEEQRKEIADV